MTLTQKSLDVFLADGPISTIGPKEIALLRDAVHKTPKGRARINAHPNSSDQLHEMIIAIEQNSYIRPHKHPAKSEAFHVVEGDVDIIIFDDDGDIQRVVPLSAPGGENSFYYRMSQPFFHTLIIKSHLLVVHEITNGPFRPEGTIFADFAPAESDAAATTGYCADLKRRAALFVEGRK
jgi:cupin fold WbuC family metalloprotein